MTSKQILRKDARALRAKLAAAQPAFGDVIARLSFQLPLRADAVVASYWPVRDEADPRALSLALAARGHKIALPCVVDDGAPLEFRIWRDGDLLVVNSWGISEPGSMAQTIVPEALLVPLLAFDASGHRLGYGGGHYDRTLEALRARGRILAIGIAYAGQEIPHLPSEARDQRLDMVVTELGVRTFGT
jgi:5-formyltetrahydrofolate cyclo-ligase